MPDPNPEKTAGEIIAEARKKAGLSLRDLSARLGIHFTYLADIEKNHRNPSEKVLRGLSEETILDLDFDDLMARVGRLDSETEQYLKEHPKFGKFVRLIADEHLNNSQLDSLLENVPQIVQKLKNSK